MPHRVVKPFSYSEDGFTLVDLNAGDERDFGAMADGLLAEGWVEEITVQDGAADAVAKPAKRMK